SAVGTPDRAHFSLNGEGAGAIVLTAPENVLIGAEAVAQSRFLARREDRRWIESAEYYALFLAALTELTSATVADVSLVTGLPVAFYDDRERLAGRLAGEHKVQREGRRSQLLRVTQVRVIPQPFGSLLALVLDERGGIADVRLAKSAVGVIDVGGKTCNLLSVNRLAEIGKETASVNVGGWDLVRAVREWLSRKYPGLDDLRDHVLAEAIQARELHFYGEPVADFPALVDALAGDLAGQVIAEASHLWNGGATLDAVLVTGGGALLLGDAIRKHWRHARLVPDPVNANAVGYWKFARRLFAQG
ncbi:MAG TPA: ParM/StbA family protein, partial [Anaerolineae bacterium]|nr:ParM/StbA family protein [Anaerolineae bacterium]